MNEKPTKLSRRDLLIGSVSLLTGAGIGASSLKLYSHLSQRSDNRKETSNTMVEMAALDPGELMVKKWQDKPVFILRRTIDMLSDLKRVEKLLIDPYSEKGTQQPIYTQNEHRSLIHRYLIVIGLCTHSGCALEFQPEHHIVQANDSTRPKGRFTCPCDSSSFDLAGRVLKGDTPATLNLQVPPHRYISDNIVIIGSTENDA